MGVRSRWRWKDAGIDLAVLGLPALVTAMQSPLHPFAKALPTTDSAVYLYSAQRMAEGKLLYVDFFEHKGPLLYLLNAVPLRISQGAWWAVWILELLLLLADGILISRIAGLYTDKRYLRLTAAAVVLYPLGFYFEGGNFTEEYALPFLLGGMYIYLDYMHGDRERLPSGRIFLAGVLCAMVVLLRVNMIVLFGIYSLVLVCYFISKGAFKDLGRSILFFAGGLAAGLLPAVLWMWFQGILGGFWDAYIVFNMAYSVGSNQLGDILRAIYVFWSREPLLPLSLVVLAGSLWAAVKQRRESRIWICAAELGTLLLSLYAVGMSGRTYGHYAMILLPCFISTAAVLLRLADQRLGSRWAVLLLTGLALLAGAPKYAAGFAINIADTFREKPGEREIIDYIQEYSAADDNVLVLGNYCMYYLGADRRTESRFFYQTPVLDVREEYRQEFLEDLKDNPPELMIAPRGDLEFEDEVLERMAEDGVYRKAEKDTFTAYLKQ